MTKKAKTPRPQRPARNYRLAQHTAEGLLQDAVCECGHLRLAHIGRRLHPFECAARDGCRCRHFRPLAFQPVRLEQTNVATLTALVDALEALLFPFQESEFEQESFTPEGRTRVMAWICSIVPALLARAEAAEDDMAALEAELAAARKEARHV